MLQPGTFTYIHTHSMAVALRLAASKLPVISILVGWAIGAVDEFEQPITEGFGCGVS